MTEMRALILKRKTMRSRKLWREQNWAVMLVHTLML